ncbi:MAG: hypothetical protein EPO07_16400, partial [Verrucomicrobia bacterium]
MQVFLQRFIERHFHSGRGGRAKLAISTNLLARIVGAAVSLINVPLAVRYLGNEGYGLLTVIVSTVGWIQFSNLGLGFGLQNTLTEQTALGNKQVQRELVSSTFFALLGIGALLALVTCLSFPHIHWTALFPPKSDRFVHEIPTAAALALGCFIASMVWGFIQPIYAARQELHLFNLQGLIANVTSLLTLYAAVKFDTGLLGIAVANIGVNALFAAGFALWTIFGRGIEEIRPSWSFVTEKATKSVLRTGLGFLILQVCTIVAFQSDAFLIAQFLSADQVTPYSVAQRVFAQLIGLLGIITAPLWPAFGNAKALGDVPWIQRIYRQVNFYFVAAYGAAFLFMAFAGHFLFHLWVGEASAPSMLLICAIGLYYFVMQWANNHSILLNGLGVIRKQTFAFVAQAALALGLNIFFVRKLGPIGLTLGGGLAYLAINAWYLPWLFHKTVKSIEP